jgi:hypothetical protein
MKLLNGLLVLLLFVNVAQAAKPRVYNYSQPTVKTYSYTNSFGSDQERCQAEANHMAANNISGHVWGTIGNFEGVGYGSSPNCNTCTPSSNMRLTGDASAQSSSGRWYRVRSWR